MRRLIALFAVLGIGGPVAAHDFWIDTPSYRLASPRPVSLRFLIGDLGDVEPWETLWRKVVALRSHGPGGTIDQQAGLRVGEGAGVDGGGASVTLATPGTHVIAFESHHAENDLPAAEFEEYVRHEGLTPALTKRAADGTGATRGRELYSRRAKAIVQVGGGLTDDALRPVGHTLEIVPERHPLALRGGEPLPLLIRYRGRPLAGASVVLEPLDGTARHGKPVVTDAAGRVRFSYAKRGRWRANVVWTQPIVHPRAEFDTVFASLTFGY